VFAPKQKIKHGRCIFTLELYCPFERFAQENNTVKRKVNHAAEKHARWNKW